MTKILTLGAVCCFAAAAMAQETQVVPSPNVTGGGPFGGTITGLLWDNGDTDGVGGYSHLGDPRRSILDDFVLEQDSILGRFTTFMIWNSGGEGLGTGFELDFRPDVNGTPGDIIATATNAVLTETTTGRTWFGRPEQLEDVTFDSLPLSAGHYWVEMHILGPENAFQMIRQDVTLNPLWVNYEDFEGLGPGRDIFGVDVDANFTLSTPEPTTLVLLGLGGLALIRRR